MKYLFKILLQAYRAELAPAVVSMLAAASKACPPGAPSRMATQNGSANSVAAIPAAVLHKDAIYAAVGTGAYELHDFIDFQPWLRTTLVQASLTADLATLFLLLLTYMDYATLVLICWVNDTLRLSASQVSFPVPRKSAA